MMLMQEEQENPGGSADPQILPGSLEDVIGILIGHSGEQEFGKNHMVQKRMTIEIEQDGVRIECAFFGTYVQEVLSALFARDLTSVVVLIQYAKIKPFRGKQSLQNAYGATRIIFNPEIPEANVVREKFFEMNEPGSQILSQMSDSSKLSLDEEFLKISDMRTLKEIKAMDEGPSLRYQRGITGGTKLASATNKLLFRLQVKVMEGNDIVTLVIFDKEASTLLQTTCADLVESSTKVCTPPTLQYSFDHSAFVNTTLSSADARSRRKIIISKKKSSNQPTSVTTTRPFLYNKWTPVNIMTYVANVGEIIQSLESSRVFPDINLDNSNFAYDSGDNSNSAYDSGNSSTDNSNSDEESNDQG
ncbi:hypothetical protein OROGR_009877 [Orobanche gracilis]